MQTRRITALLLTAFLVVELLWRWQGGISQPTTTAGAWSEVVRGAYRVESGLLVPYAAGPVLQRTALGVVRARALWSGSLPGRTVSVYGNGKSRVAVAETGDRTTLLPPYGKDFVLLDQQQNLWSVGQDGVSLLLGGGSGDGSRAALQGRTRTLQAEQVVPKGWHLVWAADPLAVKDAVWYVSNRDGALGVAAPHLWRIQAAGDTPLPALAPLGNLDLVAFSGGRVAAIDAEGALLRIDPSTLAVTQRLPGYVPLAFDSERMLLLRGRSGQAPELYLTGKDTTLIEPLRLPSGVTVLGPARFSEHGRWVALLVRQGGKTLVYVSGVAGAGTGGSGQLIAPPDRTDIATTYPPSIAADRLYVVLRSENRDETWSRSIGEDQSAFLVHGARQLAF